MVSAQQLMEALKQLENRVCFGIVAGGKSRGNIIQLKFEPKFKRVNTLPDKNLQDTIRHFGSDFGFYIGTTWRIEDSDSLLGGSHDDRGDESLETKYLYMIVGKKLNMVSLDEKTLDLVLTFEEDIVMRVFCLEINSSYDNYKLSLPRCFYTVTGHDTINFTKTEENKGLIYAEE